MSSDWILSKQSRFKFVEWRNGNTIYLSVVFSWHINKAIERMVELQDQGFDVQIGGPAISNSCLPEEVVIRHNPNATFTSRGCIRKCKFCAVPVIEGGLIELPIWIPRPIVCDNNLLACSQKHFDNVIDSLKPLRDVDFNQGLDSRLLTHHHANRIAELHMKIVRLAWDDTRSEKYFIESFNRLRVSGIPKSKIGVYVLIGFKDNPDDALYRLQTVRSLGAFPFPMRYQPVDTPIKNSFVGSSWTDGELKRFMRYWSNLRITSPIPFEEFSNEI